MGRDERPEILIAGRHMATRSKVGTAMLNLVRGSTMINLVTRCHALSHTRRIWPPTAETNA